MTARCEPNTQPEDTLAISTAPSWNSFASTHNIQCFGDGEKNVNFSEPLYDASMQRQPTVSAVHTNDELAKAINSLLTKNEAVMLSKSKILKFDGSASNFQRF